MKAECFAAVAVALAAAPLAAVTVGPDWCVAYPDDQKQEVNRVLKIAAEEVAGDINEATGLKLKAVPASKAVPVKANVSFEPGAWSSNDWTIVKGPRWKYIHGFVQKEDCIENECPPLSGEEIFKKHNSAVYSAMVLNKKAVSGQTVSSVMGFDWRMAPLIVISEKLERTPAGEPVFGEHWEIVLYDEGLNVWHHFMRNGKPAWYKAAYLKVPFEKNTRYNLEVKVAKTPRGVKEMTVKCGGYELGYVDNDLPDKFYAGIIGCEGRNMFYDFKIK